MEWDLNIMVVNIKEKYHEKNSLRIPGYGKIEQKNGLQYLAGHRFC